MGLREERCCGWGGEHPSGLGGMDMDVDVGISHWSFPPAAGGAASHGAVLFFSSQVLLCPASHCEHKGKAMVYPPSCLKRPRSTKTWKWSRGSHAGLFHEFPQEVRAAVEGGMCPKPCSHSVALRSLLLQMVVAASV